MTSRRATLTLLSLALFAPLLAARAPQAEGVRRIGILWHGLPDAPMTRRVRQQMRDTLRRQGWKEGEDLVIEERFSDGKAERLPALARELLELKVELIVAAVDQPIAAAKSVTTTVPIVMLAADSPVENGYVKTLARPGGNITGTTWSGPESAGKLLQVLKEAIPSVVQVATFRDTTYRGAQAWKDESDRAAKSLGLNVQYFDVRRVEDITHALSQIAAARMDALVTWGDSATYPRAADIAAFAIERRLAFVSTVSRYVEAGGLLSMGPNVAAIHDRTASFVDRILRGAAPAELPVEQPTKFDLIINARTAAAIGREIPAAVLVQAARVIE
jgi:putative ABC transport system substrate-binding protein